MRAQDLPSYEDLPAVEGMPHGCAWGIWDKNGEKDQLGALNLLTPEVVQAAAREIKSGDRCVLKFQLPVVEVTYFLVGVFNFPPVRQPVGLLAQRRIRLYP